jgi:N-methylhydantoinase A/oxoprolinase/acetone carboxylase beta subunit
MSRSRSWLSKARKGERAVVLLGGQYRAKIFERSLLPVGAKIKGPAIVEEKTATTLVGPGDVMTVNKYGHLVVKVKKGAV